MEWRPDSGEVVVWDWSEPADDDGDGPQGDRYAIRIHVDGRRLRGREANDWKQRIGAEFAD
jgi:hypothetical protein